LSLKDLHKCIPPSRLHQYVNLNVNLLDSFKLQVNHFGHCPYHPNVLVNFTLLGQYFIIFIILLIICILRILWAYIIPLTVSGSIQHLVTYSFVLSDWQSHHLSICHIFLLLLDHCLRIINWLCCHKCVLINRILDWVLFLVVAWNVCVSSFLCHKNLFRL
jgi:hypothetical protein